MARSMASDAVAGTLRPTERDDFVLMVSERQVIPVRLIEQTHAPRSDQQARDDEDDAKHHSTANERHDAGDDQDGGDDPKDQVRSAFVAAVLSKQRENRCHGVSLLNGRLDSYVI
jgi:hypothetical protein